MKRLLIISFYFICGICFIQAQNKNTVSKKQNQDKDNQYKITILKAQKALKENPNQGDLLILIANNYGWQQKTDSALIYLRKAEQLKIYTEDYFDALLNILNWSHQYKKLLEACNIAESHNYSKNKNVLQKKLIAYSNLNEYDKGIKLARRSEQRRFIKEKDISYLYQELLLKRNRKIITLYHGTDCFDDYRPQHLTSIGYTMPVKSHSLIFRMNYANRFTLNNIQLETDVYYRFRNKAYMYFNYGYTFNASLFPTHRIGYEYNIPLKNKMETSLGFRYLSYEHADVFILTGHLEKYMNKHWVSIRPFYTIQKDINSFTLLGNYRYYEKSRFNYWELELAYGNSPDESYSNTQNGNYNNLKAYKIKIAKSCMITRTSDLKIGVAYAKEEFRGNEFRNRYVFEIGYKIRLK